ncbi:MAG: response regulator [Spirochaetes bacterium]|nr:response regulator [Spirochaetota bacterium]
MKSSNSGHIILVDDMPVYPDLIKDVLLSEDYSNISVFFDPTEALSSVLSSNEKPFFILTDFSMPFMTGVELLQEVKKKFPTIKGAILTADPNAVHNQEFSIIDKGEQFTTKVLEIMANVA